MNRERLLEEARAMLLREFAGADLRRVELFLDGLIGRAQVKPEHPLQECDIYFPGLEARPWHETDALPWAAQMERTYPIIRQELLGLVDQNAGFYPYENPYTSELGWKGWLTYTLYRKGRKDVKNCARCPETVQLLSATPHGPRHGMFTRLHPGAHLTPHTGGSNIVLTAHLGMIIPQGCAIRVGEETRTWQEGKCLLFDDSFIHEAWNRGSEVRYVLIWDIWHPDLTEIERACLKRLMPLLDSLSSRFAN
jgi:aspartyl/asparaginyl beta-hydroxylase (cupin superfamily)